MALGEASKPNLEGPDWRIPILEWMVERKLPSDSTEAQCIDNPANAGFRARRRLETLDSTVDDEIIFAPVACIRCDRVRGLLRSLCSKQLGVCLAA
jgi:hypothetical protein